MAIGVVHITYLQRSMSRIFSGMLPLEIAVSDLMTGANSLQIVLMDAQGTNATVSSIITIGRPITGKYDYNRMESCIETTKNLCGHLVILRLQADHAVAHKES